MTFYRRASRSGVRFVSMTNAQVSSGCLKTTISFSGKQGRAGRNITRERKERYEETEFGSDGAAESGTGVCRCRGHRLGGSEALLEFAGAWLTTDRAGRVGQQAGSDRSRG